MSSVFKRGGSRAKGPWYIQYFDQNGKRRTKCAKTTDKAAAERIAAKFEADAMLRQTGAIDATLEGIGKESRRPIAEHLDDFERKLGAAGRTAKHMGHTRKFIEAIAQHGKMVTAADISEDAVTRYAEKLNKDGRAPRTIAAHLRAIKSFTRWLASKSKLPRDPLAGLKLPSAEADRRRERRAILPAEWLQLAIASEEGPERYGMQGPARRLLYATALLTGLRSNELRSLTRGQLHLDAEQPFISAKAKATKNRRAAEQFISPSLAEDLREHVKAMPADARVFRMPHEANVARMLRGDLEAARAAWLDEAKANEEEHKRRSESDFLLATNHAGEVLDFHSLRHSCATWLAQAGVAPKTAQSMLRHSNVNLTLGRYTHLHKDQEAEAVGKLQLLLAPPSAGTQHGETTTESENEACRPDANERSTAQLLAQQLAQQKAFQAFPTGTKPFQAEGAESPEEETSKALAFANLCEAFPNVSNPFQSTPTKVRTWDLRIRSPHATPQNTDEFADFSDCAAVGAAVKQAETFWPGLMLIVERWGTFTAGTRDQLLALVRLCTEPHTEPEAAPTTETCGAVLSE